MENAPGTIQALRHLVQRTMGCWYDRHPRKGRGAGMPGAVGRHNFLCRYRVMKNVDKYP
jgi:hypothetical protein